MFRTIFFVCCFLVLSQALLAQNALPVSWAVSTGGQLYDYANDMAIDHSGNIYVLGSFEGLISFGSFELQSSGGYDVLLIKYNPDGEVVWAKQGGGQGYDVGFALAIDNSDNVIITGVYDYYAQFDGFYAEGHLADVFVAKYNRDGNPLWVKGGGGEANDAAFGISTDGLNNIIITGTLQGPANFDSMTVFSNRYADIFTAKYNSDGNILWLRSTGDADYDVGYAVAANQKNEIFIAGSFSGSVFFNNRFDMLNSKGGQDIFIVKYDSDGNFIWSRSAGGPNYDNAARLQFDVNGDLLVAGTYSDTVSFGNITVTGKGYSDMFIAKYNQDNGEPLWVGHEGEPFANYDAADITSNSHGDIFLINRVAGLQEISTTFISKYSTDGKKSEQYYLNSSATANITSLAYTNNDELLFSGVYSNELTLGNISLQSNGSWDIFLGQLVFPALQFSTPEINYDPQVIGEPIRKSAVIENISNALLTISDLQLTGPDSASFTFFSGSTFVINPNSSSEVPVEFTPQKTGLNEAYFIVFSNASTSPDTIPLTGFGILKPPVFSIEQIDFGQVTIGTAIEKQIRILNPNNLRMTIKADINPLIGDYAIIEFNQNIPALGTLDITVEFNPVIAGLRRTELIISGEEFSDSVKAALTGTGIIPSLSYSTGALDFGNSEVNGNSDKAITVTNGSSADIIISNAGFTGNNRLEFSLVNNILPDTLHLNESKNFTVRLTPVSSGVKTAYLVITSNSSESPDSILLRASAFVSPLSLSDEHVDFGAADVNSNLSQIIKIINPGPSTVVINNINITGPDRDDFDTGTINIPDTLKRQTEKSIVLIFAPQSSGIKNAVLVIQSNSINSPDSITLTGSALSLISVSSKDINLGQGAELNVIPPSGFDFSDNKIFYRRSGEKTYNEAVLVSGETGYLAAIPAAYSTIRGIEYYIVFSDGVNTVTYPVNDPQNKPAVLSTKIQRINYPPGLNSSVYQMISIPLFLTISQVDSIFMDDYGEYDKSIWRLLRWDQDQGNYLEYPDLAVNFSPGSAFWLINRDAKIFDIENASSVPSDKPFLINLKNGWNQIGNPFSFAVAWDSIENSQRVQSPIYWNPETNDYELDRNILEPWKGYWIYNPSEELTLNVNPVEAGSIGKKEINSAADKSEFILQIIASEESGTRDAQNFLGMLKDANKDYDRHDIFEPPSITDKLKLSIVKDDKELAADFIPVNNEGAYWDLKISESGKKNIILSFEPVGPLPEGFNLWLLDLDKMTPVQISGNKASISRLENNESNLRLIIGTEKYAENNSANISLVPLEYVLFQNYPNPFNPSTTISYQLSSKSNVVLEIYNMLGELITTLVNGQSQEPGLHHYTWNASNLTSGVYICRIRANSFTSARSMLLLK